MQKIDGIVASIKALGEWMTAQATEEDDPYSKRGEHILNEKQRSCHSRRSCARSRPQRDSTPCSALYSNNIETYETLEVE